MTKALYTGSFDPITKGHMYIIDEASTIFDEIIIAVLNNPLKTNSFFTISERIELIKEIYKDRKNIKIITDSGAAVDIALLNECKVIVRGIRNYKDFEYEMTMNQVNRNFTNKVKTIYMLTKPELSYISSSTVKQILNLDKDISKYVDPIVMKKMLKKKGF